jgi:hypothetical protein
LSKLKASLNDFKKKVTQFTQVYDSDFKRLLTVGVTESSTESPLASAVEEAHK